MKTGAADEGTAGVTFSPTISLFMFGDKTRGHSSRRIKKGLSKLENISGV